MSLVNHFFVVVAVSLGGRGVDLVMTASHARARWTVFFFVPLSTTKTAFLQDFPTLREARVLLVHGFWGQMLGRVPQYCRRHCAAECDIQALVALLVRRVPSVPDDACGGSDQTTKVLGQRLSFCAA